MDIYIYCDYHFKYKRFKCSSFEYLSYLTCVFVHFRKFAIVFSVLKSTIYVDLECKASIITISITFDLLFPNFSSARNGFLSIYKAMPNVISPKDVVHVNVRIDIWITTDEFRYFYALPCLLDDITKCSVHETNIVWPY